jgi:hypothetical protein
MRTVVALLAGVAIVVNGSLVVDDGPLLPIVNTTLGLVQGFVDGDVNVFLSIPFAASTGGENRFLPPRQREPWGDEVLNCTQVGPGCVQGHHNADVPCGGKDLGPRCQSEDCLVRFSLHLTILLFTHTHTHRISTFTFREITSQVRRSQQ